MKIVKKSEIKEQVCKCCKSIVKVKHRDLRYEPKQYDPISYDYVTKWRCPLCRHDNIINLSMYNNYEGDKE